MRPSPSLLSCPRRRAWSNLLAGEIFSLTRVTRIFQKNVFTKTAPAGPAGAVAGFLLRARERGRCGFQLGIGRKGTTWGLRPEACPRSARSCTAINGCRNGLPPLLPCFRPVIYREPYNSAVPPGLNAPAAAPLRPTAPTATAPEALGGRRPADRPSS